MPLPITDVLVDPNCAVPSLLLLQYAHPNERSRRRSLMVQPYQARVCPDMQTVSTQQQQAHSWQHPCQGCSCTALETACTRVSYSWPAGVFICASAQSSSHSRACSSSERRQGDSMIGSSRSQLMQSSGRLPGAGVTNLATEFADNEHLRSLPAVWIQL
jgi:hypothetical protein